MSEKRTCKHENAQPSDHTTGAGVRHDTAPNPSDKGGYLNNCTVFKPLDEKKCERDPRLDELRLMGIHHTWQKVADAIGMDNFLAMWRILDAEPQFQCERSGLRMKLRSYKSYKRFQRDKLIVAHSEKGLSLRFILKRTNESLCENLAENNLSSVIKKYKV